MANLCFIVDNYSVHSHLVGRLALGERKTIVTLCKERNLSLRTSPVSFSSICISPPCSHTLTHTSIYFPFIPSLRMEESPGEEILGDDETPLQ